MLHLIGKGLAFTLYLAMLVSILATFKVIIVNYTDFTSWITPTVCYFLTRLKVDFLIGTSISFASANWLKSKVAKYWTN